MEFKPSLSSQPNPEITLSFQIQHQLVSGSAIQLFIPSGELNLFEGKPLSCRGDGIDQATCKIETEPEGFNYVITLETIENLDAFSLLEIKFSNLFQETPRFKGRMALPIVLQTSISNQVIDEYSQLHL